MSAKIGIKKKREQILKRCNEYNLKTKDKRAANRELNRDKKRAYDKEYRSKNKKLIAEKHKIYRQNNPDISLRRDKDNLREWKREKYKTDLKYRINSLMSSSIAGSLKKNKTSKNGLSWLDYVDYSIEDLVKHLKKSLKKIPGHTWNDFMEGRLHIDHILPKASFKFDSPDHPEFKRCWSLENLRLLPAIENMSKGAKCENFQTAF